MSWEIARVWDRTNREVKPNKRSNRKDQREEKQLESIVSVTQPVSGQITTGSRQNTTYYCGTGMSPNGDTTLSIRTK